jgi:hypothetical protein
MYGIVNKAIEELVIANFGNETWENVKLKSEIDIDYFISTEPYDDSITYKLAGAISHEMNMDISDVLINFGEWWILKTGKEKYGTLLSTGGKSLKEFLINLPDFHTRIMLFYPKLTPPEFKTIVNSENEIEIHYYSKREGLQEFVRGLLQGLSKLYEVETQITLIQERLKGSTHEIFLVRWN